MRESRTYGSVRGALSNERPYRDRSCAVPTISLCGLFSLILVGTLSPSPFELRRTSRFVHPTRRHCEER